MSAENANSLLTTMVAGLGFRSMAAAHCQSTALRLAPTVTMKRALLAYVGEELDRFEEASMLFQSLESGAQLKDAIEHRLAKMPVPNSWLEVVVSQVLYDRAGEMLLREATQSQDEQYRNLANTIVSRSNAHTVMVRESGNALRNLLHGDDEASQSAQPLISTWLALSIRAFGRPGSERELEALRIGLKRRSSAEQISEYRAAIEPILMSCDMKLPSAEEMGLELPTNTWI